ncbi:MAG TPA: hypothetical protein VH375_05365 [Rhodanobacteraceae bacterium]
MTAAQALRFVERHGIVLESARHATVPSLAEAIAGGPIRGSWWSHPKGRAIFAATRAVRDSPQVLVCRVVDGKISFAHERVWPALVRLADRIARTRLAREREVHTEGGAHRVEKIAFPRWVPAATSAAAKRLSEADARALLANSLPGLGDER